METFSKNPFVFLTVFLALGIFFGHFLPWFWIFLPPTLFIFLTYKKQAQVHLYLSLFLSFGLGCLLSKDLLRNQNTNLDSIYGKRIFAKVEVQEVKEWENDFRILVYVETCDLKTIIHKSIFLTTAKNKEYKVGQVLLLEGVLNPFRKPTIPEQFDFEEYNRNKGVLAQMKLEPTQILHLGEKKSIVFWVQKIRDRLEANLNYLMEDNDERAVIKALVVGDRDDLDLEVKQKYVTAGVFHVLSISGLHVALVFFAVLFFAKRIKNKLIRLFLLLGVLMFYSCLTGLSQSVIRAAVMFGIFGVAHVFDKNTRALNTLFASCFLILIVKPEFLFDSGFQLSVTAVLGILLFYKPIEGWIKPKNFFLRWLWSMMALSIAAQLTTTPFVLYYFHQFPTYFLFLNVLVVFLVDFVLVAGSFAAVLGHFYGVGDFFATCAEWLCFFVNKSSFVTSEFAYSKIKGIYLTKTHVFLLIMAVLSIYWFTISKKRIHFYMASFFLFCSLGISVERHFYYKHQKYFAFHKVKNQLVIEEVYGKSTFLYYNRSKLKLQDLEVALDAYWAKHNISCFSHNNLSYPLIKKEFILAKNSKNSKDYKSQFTNYLSVTYNRKGFDVYYNNELYFSSESSKSKFVY